MEYTIIVTEPTAARVLLAKLLVGLFPGSKVVMWTVGLDGPALDLDDLDCKNGLILLDAPIGCLPYCEEAAAIAEPATDPFVRFVRDCRDQRVPIAGVVGFLEPFELRVLLEKNSVSLDETFLKPEPTFQSDELDELKSAGLNQALFQLARFLNPKALDTDSRLTLAALRSRRETKKLRQKIEFALNGWDRIDAAAADADLQQLMDELSVSWGSPTFDKLAEVGRLRSDAVQRVFANGVRYSNGMFYVDSIDEPHFETKHPEFTLALAQYRVQIFLLKCQPGEICVEAFAPPAKLDLSEIFKAEESSYRQIMRGRCFDRLKIPVQEIVSRIQAAIG